MTTWPAIPLALGAALVFAGSSAVKHRSADGQPDVLAGHGGGTVFGLVGRTLRHPLWLLGGFFDIGGIALQATALHIGGIVLVQPLLVTSVAASLATRSLIAHRRLPTRQLGWSVLLVAALVGFVLPLQITGLATAPSADRTPGYVFGGVVLLLVAAAVAVARWSRGGSTAASALGGAAGLLYASAAALITAVTVQLTAGGVLRVLRQDEVYVLVVVAVTAQVLSQISFGAGGLAASAPVATAVDLVASVVLGLVVFDHPLPHSPPLVLASVLSLVLAIVSVFALAASERRPGATRVDLPPV